MKREVYQMLDAYMHSCMADSAHDTEHVYRVLHNALQIAATESMVDSDVLIAACLLHDIGRQAQFADPTVCHALAGAEMARDFLTDRGFPEKFAQQVRHCIQTHRFRSTLQPQTVEAKILFDADKLDATGALGIARTLLYHGKLENKLYAVLPDGRVSRGEQDEAETFFREYKFKLERLYGRFYTAEGAAMAQRRRTAAEAFYEALYEEVSGGYEAGRNALALLLEP